MRGIFPYTLHLYQMAKSEASRVLTTSMSNKNQTREDKVKLKAGKVMLNILS